MVGILFKKSCSISTSFLTRPPFLIVGSFLPGVACLLPLPIKDVPLDLMLLTPPDRMEALEFLLSLPVEGDFEALYLGPASLYPWNSS